MNPDKPIISAGAHAKWDEIPCPVCDGTDFSHLFHKAGEPFVRCSGCGLILINPRPTYDHILKTYDAGYSQGYAKKTVTKRRRAKRNVRRIMRFVPTGRWLDVGCSAGFIVEAAKNAGYDAFGIDVESWGVEYARNTLGLDNVRKSYLEDLDYPDGYFDVITVYEVIEHVPNLHTFVAALKRLLAPGGIIEIRTPDVGHWRVPRKLETWGPILPSEHLYYFSHKTLDRLLERHGIETKAKGFNLKPGIRVYVGHKPV